MDVDDQVSIIRNVSLIPDDLRCNDPYAVYVWYYLLKEILDETDENS